MGFVVGQVAGHQLSDVMKEALEAERANRSPVPVGSERRRE